MGESVSRKAEADEGDAVIAEHLVVLRAQLGDPDAFRILYDRYHDRVLTYVRQRMGSPDDADDVLQNVWVIVVRKVARLEQPQAFRTWLFRIAHSQSMSRLRRWRREVAFHSTAIEEDLAAVALEEDDFGAVPDVELEALHRGLAKLSNPHREVLILRYFEGFDYTEIAGIVGCGVGTVRSRLHYAKAALLRELTPRPASEPHHGDDG